MSIILRSNRNKRNDDIVEFPASFGVKRRHSVPVRFVLDVHVIELITDFRRLDVVVSAPFEGYSEPGFDFGFMPDKLVKSLLVLLLVGFAETQLHAGGIKISHTVENESADSEETVYPVSL